MITVFADVEVLVCRRRRRGLKYRDDSMVVPVPLHRI